MEHDFIEDLPDGSKKVKFSDTPLTINGVTVAELVMREPKVSDQLAVDHIKSAARSEVMIIANLTEQAPDAIEGLTMRQYGRVQSAYLAFMS